MKKRLVKLNNWPFEKGERAKLIWIGSPFWHEKKLMIYGYFSSKGKTKKLRLDWGTLPTLAIQHYYIHGDVSKSIAPEGIEEVELTIYPNSVNYFESDWTIFGTTDTVLSNGFGINYQGLYYTLPLIETVRSILAPNRFLLYQLLDMNAFLDYFRETYTSNSLYLDFTHLYEREYIGKNFLYQLVWLLTNQDLRSLYSDVGYNFVNTGLLKFDWTLNQPIVIKAIVKRRENSSTILRVTAVKNKEIARQKIIITHPKIAEQEKSEGAKKYALNKLNGSPVDEEDYELDEEAHGATNAFDLIEIDNQIHEYTQLPKIEKVARHTRKLRKVSDENTKKIFIDDTNKRTTADTGGSSLMRGLETTNLHEIYAEGELGEFIKVLKALEGFLEVQSIDIKLAELPIIEGSRKFSYLEDSITKRKYALGKVQLMNGHQYLVIEIERESKSLSMLILQSLQEVEWSNIVDELLQNLIKDSGVWLKQSLAKVEEIGVSIKKAKHSKKSYKHRATLLINKMI